MSKHTKKEPEILITEVYSDRDTTKSVMESSIANSDHLGVPNSNNSTVS